MCIASYFPQSIDVDVEGLTNGAKTNDDGHGWAVASANHGIERGGSMDFQEALAGVLDARARHGRRSAVVFHSRWATHGETSPFNIHPFWVGDNQDTIMAHNGVLPGIYHPNKDDRRSDTRIFVDRIARDFCLNGVPSRRGGGTLARLIGSGNKLVFMSVASGQPKVRLVNVDAGIWDAGAWYSNDGYKRSSWYWDRYSWRGGYTRTRAGLFDDDYGYEDRYEWVMDEETGEWHQELNPRFLALPRSAREDEPEYIYEAETGLQYDNATGEYACYLCEGRVDAVSGFCIDCDTCQACMEEFDSCDCHVPLHMLQSREMARMEAAL